MKITMIQTLIIFKGNSLLVYTVKMNFTSGLILKDFRRSSVERHLADFRTRVPSDEK